MKTTLNKIRIHNPCSSANYGWKKLLKYLGEKGADDKPLSITTILDSNGLDDALWCLRAVEGKDRQICLFAVWCARQVQHLMKDFRSIDALDVAKRFDSADAKMSELDSAKDSAKDAALDASFVEGDAWSAAWSAAAALEAAYFSAAATHKANAADAASDAAYFAAAAADHASNAAWEATYFAACGARDYSSLAAYDPKSITVYAANAARADARRAQEAKLRRICKDEA